MSNPVSELEALEFKNFKIKEVKHNPEEIGESVLIGEDEEGNLIKLSLNEYKKDVQEEIVECKSVLQKALAHLKEMKEESGKKLQELL